jgi:hypothetical protein
MTDYPTILEHWGIRWFAQPLKLRQRWWKETDYGRFAPSQALLQDMITAQSVQYNP